jgi:radical SAM protein with 4Fe4S-binding SPASM domain
MADQLLIPATPTTYTLELTSRCNSGCVGCGNVFERALGEMGIERWRHVLMKLKPHIVNVRVTGGEPTLHAQFEALIRLIDGLSVPFVIFSNGLWLDPSKTLAILLDCANLDGVLISLHGKDAVSHQAFVGIDSFDRVTTTIRLAAQAGLAVNTNTVLTRYNYRDIPAIVTLSRDLGARSAAFSRYYGPPTDVTELPESEFRLAVAAAHRIQQQGFRVQFNNCVPLCFDGKPTKSCPAGITHCTVDPLGRVRPCTHAPHVLGDLFSQSITGIWHGQAANQWRALIPPICKTCVEFVRCRGACKAMAYHRNQDKDPLIRKPLQEPLLVTNPSRIQLYAGARPQPNFVLRQEDFGYLLINRNQIIPVKSDAKPLLDMLDGTTTLRQLQDEFGQPGLAFVAYLFKKGLVHLSQ